VTCTDHGLLLSGPMVRAFLRGDKTSTMRPITARNSTSCLRPALFARWLADDHVDLERSIAEGDPAPRIQPGHTIWFRETFAGDDLCGHVYRADHPHADLKRGDLDDGDQSLRCWKPAIHMPRVFARCRARVLHVYPRRPCDLTSEELQSEGFPLPADEPDYPGATFDDIWQLLHPDARKDVWCWFYRFEPIEAAP
jgi:hypothetical protein